MKLGKHQRRAAEQILSDLYAKEGHLTASAVLHSARSEKSPLHSIFDWDDTSAAEKYRLHQARNLIKSVYVTHQGQTEIPVHVSVYVSNQEGVYKLPQVLVQEPDAFARAFDEACKILAAAQQAVDKLRRYAEGRDDDRMALIVIAQEAVVTAKTALTKVA